MGGGILHELGTRRGETGASWRTASSRIFGSAKLGRVVFRASTSSGIRGFREVTTSSTSEAKLSAQNIYLRRGTKRSKRHGSG